MYKVRFHLAKGINYKNWQVSNLTYKSVDYYDPNKYQIIMRNCILKNVKNIANKIYSGSNKIVCAWISCDHIDVVPEDPKINVSNLKSLSYNPRSLPFWSLDGIDVDNNNYNCLVTKSNKVFVKYE